MKEIIVLGHTIKVHSPSGDYDMMECTSLPNIPGPPPHFHTAYHELFLVLEGKMEFLVNGEIRTVEAGECVDLPPRTIHTFKNSGEVPCRYLNIHSPKGFLALFEEFGVNSDEENAFEKSVAEDKIQGLVQKAATYDMFFAGE